MWRPGSRGTKGRKRRRKKKKLTGSLQGWWMWGCVTQVSFSCRRKKDTQIFTILIPIKYHLSNAVLLPGTRDHCQKAVSPHATFFQRQRLGLWASWTHQCMGANEHTFSLSPTPTVMHSTVYLLFHPIKLELSPLCPQVLLPSTTALLKCLSLPFFSSCRHYSFDLPGFLPVPPVCFLFSLPHPWGMLTDIGCSVGAQNINSNKCPQPHQLSCNRCHRSTETRSASR